MDIWIYLFSNGDGYMDMEEVKSWIIPPDFDHRNLFHENLNLNICKPVIVKNHMEVCKVTIFKYFPSFKKNEMKYCSVRLRQNI